MQCNYLWKRLEICGILNVCIHDFRKILLMRCNNEYYSLHCFTSEQGQYYADCFIFIAGKEIPEAVLINDLQDLASEWKQLGLQLDISKPRLDAIAGEKLPYFEDVLQEWLDTDTDSTKEKLLEVLRTEAVKEDGLASRIENDEGMQWLMRTLDSSGFS